MENKCMGLSHMHACPITIDLLLVHLTGAIICTVYSTFGVAMGTKFSEDVIPLTDLKINPGRV